MQFYFSLILDHSSLLFKYIFTFNPGERFSTKTLSIWLSNQNVDCGLKEREQTLHSCFSTAH